jgi:hypothetical protein
VNHSCHVMTNLWKHRFILYHNIETWSNPKFEQDPEHIRHSRQVMLPWDCLSTSVLPPTPRSLAVSLRIQGALPTPRTHSCFFECRFSHPPVDFLFELTLAPMVFEILTTNSANTSAPICMVSEIHTTISATTRFDDQVLGRVAIHYLPFEKRFECYGWWGLRRF